MGGKSRLSADPSVGVSDLQKVLAGWFQEVGSKDVLQLLKGPYTMTWKSAPTAEWLGAEPLAALFSRLFGVCCNGVVASKKLKAAILAQQTAGGRMNFTRKHDSDWVDDVDTLTRVACQMYREAKKDSTKYVRCVRKASVQEKERLDFVLGCLQLDDQAPVVAMDQQETEPEPEVRTVAPGSVFSKVLAKKPSAPDPPEKATLAVVSTTFTSSSSGSQEASMGRPTLRRQMAFLELDSKEEKEMMKWMCSSSSVSKAPKRLKRPAAQKKAESKGKKKVQKDKKATVKKRAFVQKVLKCSFRKRVCDSL